MSTWTLFTWRHIGVACLLGLAIGEINVYLVTAVLHRSMCHRAIVYPNWLKRTVAVWLWLTVFTSALGWIAAHLHHHANPDTERDPHAPSVKGFWRVLLLTWYYVPHWVRANRRMAEQRYLGPFREERLLRWLEIESTVGLNFYCQLIGSLVLGPAAIAFWFSRVVPYILASGYVNAAGHTFGERPFGTVGNDSTGPFQEVAGYLIGGEPLGHNFHHRHPTSPRFRLKRFDPGFWFGVRLLQGVPAGFRRTNE